MEEKTVVIIGNEPSLTETIKVDDSCIYVALNSAILACDGIVHYHFMDNFGNIDKIPMRHLLRTKNVVIPSYPHTILPNGKECSDVNMPAQKFIDKYPQWFRTRFTLFDLPTTPKRHEDIPFYPVRLSVAESAVYHMIALGYRDFKFIGVGDCIDTSSELIGGCTTRQGFSQKVRTTLETILKDNGCTYKFPYEETESIDTQNTIKSSDKEQTKIVKKEQAIDKKVEKDLTGYTYTVLNTNTTYKLESGTQEFKFVKVNVKKATKHMPARVCHSVDKSDFSRILAQRLGQLR